jgi:hypothetical protein
VRTLGAPCSETPCTCYPALSARPGFQQPLKPKARRARHETRYLPEHHRSDRFRGRRGPMTEAMECHPHGWPCRPVASPQWRRAASISQHCGWPPWPRGTPAPIWMTFKQAIDRGGCVRKAASIKCRRALRAASRPDSACRRRMRPSCFSLITTASFNSVELQDPVPPRHLSVDCCRRGSVRVFAANLRDLLLAISLQSLGVAFAFNSDTTEQTSI